LSDRLGRRDTFPHYLLDQAQQKVSPVVDEALKVVVTQSLWRDAVAVQNGIHHDIGSLDLVVLLPPILRFALYEMGVLLMMQS